jgi:hypothetical protein
VSPASPEVSSTATGGLRHFPAGVVAESATSPESVGSVGILDGQELHLDLNGLHGTLEVGDNAVEAWLHKRDAAAGGQVQPRQMLHLSQPFTANLETSRVRRVMNIVGLRCPASSHNLQLCVCKLAPAGRHNGLKFITRMLGVHHMHNAVLAAMPRHC